MASDRQPSIELNNKKLDDPTAVPTYQVAAEKLLEKIEREHGGCVEAAEAAAAADCTGKRAAAPEPKGGGSPPCSHRSEVEVREYARRRLAECRTEPTR